MLNARLTSNTSNGSLWIVELLKNLDCEALYSMKMLKIVPVFFLIFLLSDFAFGQTMVSQPRILVVPFTTSDGNALDEYESKPEMRQVMVEIANAMNQKGFQPDDFQEVIRKVKENDNLNLLRDVEVSAVDRILQFATSDIVIYSEIFIHRQSDGSNSVQINLRAVDKVSSKSMYSQNFIPTPHFRTDDFGFLGQRALNHEGQLDKFINGLNGALSDMRQNGRSISLRIQKTDASNFSLSDEVDETNYLTLSDVIIDHVKKSAFKNNFRITSNTARDLYFDEVRIPILDSEGNNYLPSDFARDVRILITKAVSDFSGERVRIEAPEIRNGTITFLLP